MLGSLLGSSAIFGQIYAQIGKLARLARLREKLHLTAMLFLILKLGSVFHYIYGRKRVGNRLKVVVGRNPASLARLLLLLLDDDDDTNSVYYSEPRVRGGDR